jgi:hypothetical protein
LDKDKEKVMAATLSLKWGTLKNWNFKGNKKGKELLKEYCEIGSSISAMDQRDTPRQKEIICELIDLCTAKTIYLDWDGKRVPKEEAKKYVLEYS